MKIATVSIAKNEEKFVIPWVESARESDYLIILDTGSTDNTVELARSMGVIVHEKTYSPWRFDHARNDLLALIPDDVDYVINLDLDEVLVAGWREHMDKMDTNITAPRYKYVWNWQDDGSEGLVYHGYKIHKRHGYEWRHPVHEIMCPLIPEVQGWIGLEIHHHADPSKSRGQYLPLLKLSVEEDPEDDRNAYYYARELFFYGHTEESVAEFKRHLSLPRATWRPERAFSMRYLAKMMPEEREDWLLRACAEYPTGRETWVDLARHYFTIGNWEGCYHASKRALSITHREALYLTEAESWGWLPWDFAAISAFRLGKFDEALELGCHALDFAPQDERLNKNMFYYNDALAKVNVVIPFKINLPGLSVLMYQLSLDKKVDKVVIVADGEEAYELLKKVSLSGNVVKTMVPLGSGIHHMWNLGMDIVGNDGHIAFINDDVELGENCLTNLAEALSLDPRIGLVCPNYTSQPMLADTVSFTTCRGRYDGSGGIAGFCFLLNKQYADKWRFDESMKWWYGDDDLVNALNKKYGAQTVIVAKATCKHAHSQTINTLPPNDFAFIVANDEKIFKEKWADIEAYYRKEVYRRQPADIVEHLDTLTRYASQVETVVELGTRFGTSTMALLRGKPRKLVTIDLNKKFFAPYEEPTKTFARMCGVDFSFLEADDLIVNIDKTELLFIDTYHTYAQLSAELRLHAPSVSKWIILHDTESFGYEDESAYEDALMSTRVDETSRRGLRNAVDDFLAVNDNWKIVEHYYNCNGLSVLERQS